MSKALEVGEVLRYSGDGPERIFLHLVNEGPGARFKSETGVVFQLNGMNDFQVVEGSDDGLPPAQLTVVSL